MWVLAFRKRLKFNEIVKGAVSAVLFQYSGISNSDKEIHLFFLKYIF